MKEIENKNGDNNRKEKVKSVSCVRLFVTHGL